MSVITIEKATTWNKKVFSSYTPNVEKEFESRTKTIRLFGLKLITFKHKYEFSDK